MGRGAEPGSLRQLINQRIDELKREISSLRSVFEIMPERPVKHYELESLKFQVASLAEGLAELEQRVIQLEQHKSTASQVLRHGIVILLTVFLVYLIGGLR